MSEPAWVALGAQPVDYAGAWAAGTQYAPGDVVRYNGVDYLAVNPSLGSTPPATLSNSEAGVRVTHSVDFTLTDSVNMVHPFDTELYDPLGFHSPSVNNSRLTVPAGLGGKYHIQAQAAVGANTATIISYIRLNGATMIAKVLGNGSGSIDADNHVATIYQLAAGDYVEFVIFQAVGANRPSKVLANYAPIFVMQRIGA